MSFKYKNQLNNSKDNYNRINEKDKNNNLFKIIKIENSNNNLLENKNIDIEQNNKYNFSNIRFLVIKKKENELKDDSTKSNINEEKKELSLEENDGKPIPWTKEDDKLLLIKAQQNNEKNWKKVASSFKGRTSIQCSSRYHRIKPGLTKGHFSKEEDLKLISLYKIYGKKWNLIAKAMKNRTGKQVRDRFLNSLAPGVNKNRFTIEEDMKILKYYKIYGRSWSSIAKYINGRTGDMIKNRFYSNLCKNYEKENNLLELNEEEEEINYYEQQNINNVDNNENNQQNYIQSLINSYQSPKQSSSTNKNQFSNNSLRLNILNNYYSLNNNQDNNNFIKNQDFLFQKNNTNKKSDNLFYNYFGNPIDSINNNILFTNLIKEENKLKINNNYCDKTYNFTSPKNSGNNFDFIFNNNNNINNNNNNNKTFADCLNTNLNIEINGINCRYIDSSL